MKKISLYVITNNSYVHKGGFFMAKKKRDAGKIFVRVMASILALLMLLGICGTLLFYLIAM